MVAVAENEQQKPSLDEKARRRNRNAEVTLMRIDLPPDARRSACQLRRGCGAVESNSHLTGPRVFFPPLPALLCSALLLSFFFHPRLASFALSSFSDSEGDDEDDDEYDDDEDDDDGDDGDDERRGRRQGQLQGQRRGRRCVDGGMVRMSVFGSPTKATTTTFCFERV